MTDLSLHQVKTAHVRTGDPVSGLWSPGFWSRVKETLKTWQRRDRDRHYLSRMSAYERADLAVPPYIIEQEILKPFWRA